MIFFLGRREHLIPSCFLRNWNSFIPSNFVWYFVCTEYKVRDKNSSDVTTNVLETVCIVLAKKNISTILLNDFEKC